VGSFRTTFYACARVRTQYRLEVIARRYPTAQDLIDELGRYLTGEPIKARPISRMERAVKWARRRPALAALIAVCVLGVFAVFTQWYRAEASLVRLNARTYLNQIALADSALSAGDFARADRLLTLCPPGLRNWEWNHLRRKCQSKLTTLNGRGLVEKAWGADFSPDGRKFAVLEIRNWVNVYDTLTGQLLLGLYAPGGEVCRVRFTSDGERIALASYQAPRQAGLPTPVHFRLYDSSDGHRIHSAQVRTDIPSGSGLWVAVSPDGKRFATAGCQTDGSLFVRVWDAMTGEEVLSLGASRLESTTQLPWVTTSRLAAETIPEDIEEAKSALEYSDDGKRVILKRASAVNVWNAERGEELVSVPVKARWTSDYAVSPDGARLLVPQSETTIAVWDAVNRRQLVAFHHSLPQVVRFSPDGNRIALGGRDGSVALMDAATGRELSVYRDYMNVHRDYVSTGVWYLAFSQDGEHLASSDRCGTVRLWHLADPQAKSDLRENSGPIRCIAFAPDARRFATASGDHTVTVWNSESAEPITFVGEHWGPAKRLAFSNDGNRVILYVGPLVYPRRKVDTLAIDVGTGRQTTVDASDVPLVSDAVSPDGEFTAENVGGGSIKISAGAKRLYWLDPRIPAAGYCIAFSPANEWIVAGADYGVEVWLFRSASRRFSNLSSRTLQGHTGPIRSVAFSADGKRLASASDDGTIKLWNTATWEEILTLKGHTGPVRCVAFSGDGQRLLSGGDDGSLRFWDAPMREAVAGNATLPWSYFGPPAGGLFESVLAGCFQPLLAAFCFLFLILPLLLARWSLRNRMYRWQAGLFLVGYLASIHALLILANLPRNTNAEDIVHELVRRVYLPTLGGGLPFLIFLAGVVSCIRKRLWRTLALVFALLGALTLALTWFYWWIGGPIDRNWWVLPYFLAGMFGLAWIVLYSVVRWFLRSTRTGGALPRSAWR